MMSDAGERAGGQGGSMPPATGGRRIGWAAVPAGVRAAIGRLLGGEVVEAAGQPGGFSEGLAARVLLADGRRAFVKAVDAVAVPAVAAHHRREIAVTRELPRDVPVPRLLEAYDDGAWVALAFEDVPGRLPAQPWRRSELDRVLATLTDLSRALTPAPLDPGLLAPPRLGGWPALAASAHAAVAARPDEATSAATGGAEPNGVRPARAARWIAGRLEHAAAFGAAGPAPHEAAPSALFGWAARHLDELVALDRASASTTTGGTLLHGDLYPFNVLLAPDRVVVVDWPHAWVGAPYCDVVTLLSGVSLSGLDPRPLAERHPLTRDVPPADLDALLAAHSGFLLRAAVSCGPDADPRLVGMMVALGSASLRWLRQRWSRR